MDRIECVPKIGQITFFLKYQQTYSINFVFFISTEQSKLPEITSCVKNGSEQAQNKISAMRLLAKTAVAHITCVLKLAAFPLYL